jgi:hypothetical protein
MEIEMTTCVILQPSYVPWLGVFQLMAQADVYVHYDDVQYDKNGWRNRNTLKTAEGKRWMTIPVSLPKGKLSTPLNQTMVHDSSWEQRHKQMILNALDGAPHLSDVVEQVFPVMVHSELLLDVTIPLLEHIANLLGLQTKFLRSSDLSVSGRGTDRLVTLCERIEATNYLTGPSARDYLDESQFHARGLTVEWMNYSIDPYSQLHGEFDAHVSVLDALANVGVSSLAQSLL